MGNSTPTFALGAQGMCPGSSWREEQSFSLLGAPPDLQTLQPLPQTSRVVSGWVGLGTQAQGWGQWGSGVQAGGPGSPKEEKQPGSNNRQLGARGRRAGSTSTRVAQGSSGGRASERAGAKLSRKETHISHVSLAGPTAGAL